MNVNTNGTNVQDMNEDELLETLAAQEQQIVETYVNSVMTASSRIGAKDAERLVTTYAGVMEELSSPTVAYRSLRKVSLRHTHNTLMRGGNFTRATEDLRVAGRNTKVAARILTDRTPKDTLNL